LVPLFFPAEFEFSPYFSYTFGMIKKYLVIGAGAAGVKAAEELRRLDAEAQITLVNGEDRLPYKRTKISKALAQGFAQDEFATFPESWYIGNRIELLTGWTAENIDPRSKTVDFGQRGRLGYDKLLLSLGSIPHHSEAPVLRNAGDGENLRKIWQDEPSIRILGGGVLGVEMAEQAHLMGKKTTLVSRSGVLLGNDLTPEVSKRLGDLLLTKGIKLVVGTSQGSLFHGAALGSPPRVQLARKSGLDYDLGILVNSNFQTSEEDIYAAGDCCQLPSGQVCHLWHEAESQGAAAARSMANFPVNFDPRPYRLKLEVFDDYYFSMGRRNENPWKVREFPSPIFGGKSIYQAWFGDGEGVSGVVMAGDKERAKVYEQAVLEHWNLEKVSKDLG